jgi:hypothetical protein
MLPFKEFEKTSHVPCQVLNQVGCHSLMQQTIQSFNVCINVL